MGGSKDIKDRQKFIDTINKLLLSPSKRNFNKIKQELETYFKSNQDVIKVLESQKTYDFYPTPEECLDKDLIKRIIKNSDNILEPTAGLGAIMNFISKINPEAKLTGNELNPFFYKILQEFFPNDTITNQDYLEYNKINNFDLILMNPPFSLGNDSYFYIDFIFHSLYLLNKKSKAKGEKSIIVICPPLQIKHPEVFGMGEFLNSPSLSTTKIKKIAEKHNIKLTDNILKCFKNKKDIDDLTDNEQDIISKFEDYFDFAQGQYLGSCGNFAGTKIKADIYLLLVYSSNEILEDEVKEVSLEKIPKSIYKKIIPEIVKPKKLKTIKPEKVKPIKQDLTKITVPILKQMAKEKGLKGYSKLRKEELIKLLS